jgi:hypothetical protein
MQQIRFELKCLAQPMIDGTHYRNFGKFIYSSHIHEVVD